MRFLGIDYGEKNIGIACSDESDSMAFPVSVIKNDKNKLANIRSICLERNVGAVVIGESLNLKGEPNLIMKEIELFKENIEANLKLPVFLEQEFYTTRQSIHIQGENKMTDASAATIILQSFLDKRRN